MAPSVAMRGGPAPEWVVQHHTLARPADPEQVITLVVAMAGYFVQRSLLPAPPGLLTLRAFQAGQGGRPSHGLRPGPAGADRSPRTSGTESR